MKNGLAAAKLRNPRVIFVPRENFERFAFGSLNGRELSKNLARELGFAELLYSRSCLALDGCCRELLGVGWVL